MNNSISNGKDMDHRQLAARIAEVALLHGDFTLRSGRKSKYYLDKYRFETQPDVLIALGRMFAKKVTDGVDRIAGPELGAVALAAATSMTGILSSSMVAPRKNRDLSYACCSITSSIKA